MQKSLLAVTAASAGVILLILFFLFLKAWPVWQINGLRFLTGTDWDQQFARAWSAPAESPVWASAPYP
ncbi:MAG: hypothetical protein ACPLPT_09135 [Moorellales bacterium]